MTLYELRNKVYKMIDAKNKERVAFDFLLSKHSNKRSIEIILSNDQEVDFNLDQFFEDLDEYLETDLPIQKIVKEIMLANVKLDLSENVLIPRLETEELIYLVQENVHGDEKILDLCAGSGFIGLALKKAVPQLEVTLSDVDPLAIKQMEINLRKNDLSVRVIRSDLFRNISEKFDIIICNPPYIPINEKLPNSVLKHEPHHALFAGEEGLDFYKKIIDQIDIYLTSKPGIKIFFEIGENQAIAVQELLSKKGFSSFVERDINQKDRFIYAWYDH